MDPIWHSILIMLIYQWGLFAHAEHTISPTGNYTLLIICGIVYLTLE
jgi:hypothetical protein